MTSHFKTISVVDANGDQLTLYEIRERASPLRLVPRTRLQLCTGELVKKVGSGFVVESTGEQLTRVASAP